MTGTTRRARLKCDAIVVDPPHMLIDLSTERPFIFVANTKAASTAIERSALGQHCDIRIRHARAGKHMALSGIHENFQYIFANESYPFDRFFKFGVIRDPLEWVVSWYNYRSDLKFAERKIYAGNLSFREFWEFSRTTQPYEFAPQTHRFFSPTDPSVCVDYLIDFPNLRDRLATIAPILGYARLELSRSNASKLKRVAVADVDADLKAEIRDHYRLDYDTLANLPELNARGLERFRDRAMPLQSHPTPAPYWERGLKKLGGLVRPLRS